MSLETGKLTPCEMPSFLGKLQHADAQVWGRAGRMALRDLRSHGSFSRVPVSLDASGLEALKLLKDRLLFGKPRTIHSAWQERPMLVFSDGALEEGSKLGCPATVGGVLFDPERPGCASVFGSKVPEDLPSHWRSDGKTHVVGLIELYAAILSLRFWRRRLEGRRVILFIDSWPALDSLVKGDSTVRLWRELLLVRENPEEQLPMFLWVARVPSRSNVADPPSRGSVDELSSWKLTVEYPRCPLCKRVLSSLL